MITLHTCDPQGHFKFYVFPHLPEPFRAARPKYQPKVQEVQARNEGKPPANQEKTRITGTKLFINDDVQIGLIQPPPSLQSHQQDAGIWRKNSPNSFGKIQFRV